MGKAPLACRRPAGWTPTGPTHGKLHFRCKARSMPDRRPLETGWLTRGAEGASADVDGLAARNAAVAPCAPCTPPIAPTAGSTAGPGNDESGRFWPPPPAARASFPPTTPASSPLDAPTPLASATLAAAGASPVCPGTAAPIFDRTAPGGRGTQLKAPETDVTKMKSWRVGGVEVGAAKKGALDALGSDGKSLAESSGPGAERPAADGARGAASPAPSRTEAPPSPAQASCGDEANTV